MEEKRDLRKGLIISLALCTVLAVSVSLCQMSFQEEDLPGRLLSWSNGCFTAGALWFAVGLLALISSFDGFRAMQYLAYVVRCKWNRRGEDTVIDSYFDYVSRKKSQREGKKGYRILFVPAVVYLAAAAVLTVLFELCK